MKVAVEKNEIDVRFESNTTYPVLNEFKYEQVLGFATMSLENGVMYADLKLKESAKGYPAIGYTTNGKFKKLFAIGISQTVNQDPSIEHIEYTLQLEGKPSNLKTK